MTAEHEVSMAIASLRDARDRLVAAGAVKAADKVRRAIESAEGALRHARHAPYRAERGARKLYKSRRRGEVTAAI